MSMVKVYFWYTSRDSTLQDTARHCKNLQPLQRTETHCNTLQYTGYASHRDMAAIPVWQHTATHRNTLHRTATHCIAQQRTATHCNTLQYTEYALHRDMAAIPLLALYASTETRRESKTKKRGEISHTRRDSKIKQRGETFDTERESKTKKRRESSHTRRESARTSILPAAGWSLAPLSHVTWASREPRDTSRESRHTCVSVMVPIEYIAICIHTHLSCQQRAYHSPPWVTSHECVPRHMKRVIAHTCVSHGTHEMYHHMYTYTFSLLPAGFRKISWC